MHPQGSYLCFASGNDAERDGGQVGGFLEMVLRSNYRFEVPFRLEQFCRILDDLIDGGRRELLAIWQAEITGQRPIEKIFRLQPNGAEEEIRMDVERQTSPAACVRC